VHPIYNLHFLLHRRFGVEEPHKRNAAVQCANCQEYGHTRSYCKLRPVSVLCGELHDSAHCPASKDDCNSKKWGKCGGLTQLTTEVAQFIRSWKVASIREEQLPAPKINSWQLPDQTLKSSSRLQPDPH